MSNDKTNRGVVLSGMRPTGELHIGHFEAVLRNWVQLQETHDCFYFVADWHATTTEDDTSNIPKYAVDNVKDWLAFGVDPERSVIFAQSHVPEHFELAAHLLPLVNYGRLVRMPTFKGYVEHVAGDRKVRGPGKTLLGGDERLESIAKSDITSAFLVYPVVQSADVLLYGTTDVPIGEDQVPHIELTRELARSFNARYGNLFPIPEAGLMETKRILGTDGRKMSKSYDNVISPGMTPKILGKKVRSIRTVRPRLEDEGNPFDCAVYDLHRIFSGEDLELEVQKGCREAAIRCGDCKGYLPAEMTEAYQDFRERRAEITDDFVIEVLQDGNKKAQARAQETMRQVREHMKLDYAL